MKSHAHSWILVFIIFLLFVTAPMGQAGQAIAADQNQTTYFVYLPATFYSHPPRGIFGTLTWDIFTQSGVSLDLRFYDGNNWSTIASTMSMDDGSFSFPDVDSLAAGQYYYVRYLNQTSNTGHVYFYATRNIENYEKGAEVDLGKINIKDIPLDYPTSGASVSLPVTFSWSVRPATQDDSYEFDLYDPDSDLQFYTDPPLGYVGQYTLTALPSGFVPNKYYYWEIWVYDPSGGYGISFNYWPVRFSSSESSSQGEFLVDKIPAYLNRSVQSDLDIGK